MKTATHDVIYDDAHGHPGADTCKNCDSNSLRDDWRKPCKKKKRTTKQPGGCRFLSISLFG